MKDFDRRFKSLISDRDGVPEGYERRVEGRLATLPPRIARERKARVKRPAVIALSAALAVCLLAGTALAVSPALRQLLWGGFEPYAQELDPTPENTRVYDGVEARIASALSDGYINVIHVELRDLEGDRVRKAWGEYLDSGKTDFLDGMSFITQADRSAMKEAGDSMGGLFTASGPRPIGFDEDTGAMTVECVLTAAIPLDMDRSVAVDILPGSLYTKKAGVDEPAGAQNGENALAEVPVNGSWHMEAKLAALPIRSVDVGAVEVEPVSAEASRLTESGFQRVELEDESMYFHTVEISQLGVTMNRDGDVNDGGSGYFETRFAPDELTVKLRDGTVLALTGHLSPSFNLDGDMYSSEIWTFSEPLDPDSVVSVTLGGTEMPLA